MQPGGELQRRLPAELDDDALGLLDLAHADHVLERQRLEVQPVGGVVVGRDRLRVAVDHDRVAAELAHGLGRVHAAVVELDPLADPVRPRAEDHDARALAALDLVGRTHQPAARSASGLAGLGGAGVIQLTRALPAGVVVRRASRELGRAGVDGLERPLARERRLDAASARQLGELVQEPRVDARAPVQLVDGGAAAQRLEQVVEALGRGLRDELHQRAVVGRGRGTRVELARAQRLRERLLERAPDRHRLADRLHVRGQAGLGAGELLEREPRPLDHAVVDRRLEARRRRPGDVVGDLLQRVADREPGGDLRDREAGRLARQRARARDPRVHLDHDDLVGGGVDGELDVRAAGLDADGADHRDRLVAQRLVLLVGERLLRRDADAVAGVDAHRVEVLDRADDHDVVRAVAHHLELELAPAEHRLLEQHLTDRRGGQPPANNGSISASVADDAAAGAAERERGTDDERQPDVWQRRAGIVDRVGDRAARHAQSGRRSSSRGSARGPRRGRSPRSRRRSARPRGSRACRPRAAPWPG